MHNAHIIISSLEIAKNRALLVCIAFIFVFIVVVFRINFLVFRNEEYVLKPNQSKKFYQQRNDIVDRNGVLLATNVATYSLYADVRKISNPRMMATKITSLLPQCTYKKLFSKLKSGKKFVWIARHLTPLQQDKILHAGLPDLKFIKDVKRMYVHGNLTSHILGLTNIDNYGISGIEKSYNNDLHNQNKLHLSIDTRIQHCIRDTLIEGIKEFSATGAAAIVMEIESGEILGMVSLPDYDPNQAIQVKSDTYFNRAVSGMYEMGSTLKIHNTAMVLDNGVVDVATIFNTSSPVRIGKYKITDYRANYGKINVAEIFVNSSNKGSVLMLLKASGEMQKSFLDRLGCLSRVNIEIPETGTPIYPYKWTDASSMSISYGYGLAISPLHLLNSVATIIGGGCKKEATLIKGKKKNLKCNRIIKESTSRIMNKLMHFGVTSGHSKKAKVPGYFVFAKTGTRNMLLNGKYVSNRVSTTFVGAIGNDIEDPKYMVVVLLEDPKATKNTIGFTTAGWNAAPIGGKILSRVANIMGLQPIGDVVKPNFKNFLKEISD